MGTTQPLRPLDDEIIEYRQPLARRGRRHRGVGGVALPVNFLQPAVRRPMPIDRDTRQTPVVVRGHDQRSPRGAHRLDEL